jgi:hypothetical protein
MRRSERRRGRSEPGAGVLRGEAERGGAAGGGERKLRVATGEGGSGKLTGGARASAAPGEGEGARGAAGGL